MLLTTQSLLRQTQIHYMALIIFLTLIIIAALAGLNLLDRIDQKNRRQRLKIRRLQSYSENLQDIISALAMTIPNQRILIAINEHLIEQLNQASVLDEDINNDAITQALEAAKLRAEQWEDPTKLRATQYHRDSDAQIAQTQMHVKDAIELLPVLASQGKISPQDLEPFLSELQWANLMISVMSFFMQGQKAMSMSDRFTAQAFYRKAQQLLMESLHTDKRRLKMIKELSEIIEGARRTFSYELINTHSTDEPLEKSDNEELTEQTS